MIIKWYLQKSWVQRIGMVMLPLWVGNVQANEALELLGRMQAAVNGLDYQGQVVYSRGDELSTFRITHQPGQTQESVVRLDHAGSTSTKTEHTEHFSLSSFGKVHQAGMDAYAFDLGGDAQVAEHPCKVVVARPKDKLRYLHRYCIDPESGLLLKYSLMDREQRVLEQLMFTQLQINQGTPATANNSPIPARAMQAKTPVAALAAVDKSQVDQAIAVALEAPPKDTPKEGGALKPGLVLGVWDFQALPAGFKVVKVIPDTADGNAHQIVLSDGMASVSVFIAPAAAARSIDELSYSSGATHILGLELAGHVITFVGEVPAATLQTIQKGLRYVAR